MTTAPEQRTKLKAAAEAATPGEWELTSQNGDPEESFRGVVGPVLTNSWGHDYRLYVAQYCLPENAAFIAAANPEAILSLLAEIESLEARVASAEGALRPFADFASLPGFDKLPEKVHVTNGSSLAARQITVGDLRAARAHFQSQGGDHGRD